MVYLKEIKNYFLYHALPKLVDFITTVSAHNASKKLRGKDVTILVDNTVIGQGVTHETAWIDTGKKRWGDIDVDTGYMARIPVYSDKDNSELASPDISSKGSAEPASIRI